MAITLVTTCIAVGGGTNPVAGTGMDTLLTVGGNWAVGDTFTIDLTNGSTGYQDQVGAGNVTGIPFSYVFTFGNKVFGLNASTVYACAIASPTTWNDPNGIGNGYITMSNWYATNEALLAGVPYQGRLAFFSRRTAQIWITDPNLSNWTQQQILTDIGTVASLSVQSLGDLDVLFLSDTGFRSLRVRDQSLNAYVNDIGSPVDQLIQTALLTGTPPTACAIVEPQANRYWCYLNGLIYVLSYFPSVKITAWSTYQPTYTNFISPSGNSYGALNNYVTYVATPGQVYYWIPGANEIKLVDGSNVYTTSVRFTAQTSSLVCYGTANASVTCTLQTQTTFTPQKFLIFHGQVYCRDTTNFYVYGGAGNNTYDACVGTISTSWLDAKKPVVRKMSKGFDAAFVGAWSFSIGMDPLNETQDYVWQGSNSTFQHQSIPYTADGYHVRFTAATTGAAYASLGSLIFRYEEGEEK